MCRPYLVFFVSHLFSFILVSNADSKKSKRIFWADSTGKALTESRELGPTEYIAEKSLTNDNEPEGTGGDMSWSDRNKRDRLREKELFEQARSVILMSFYGG
jgi:hypothetical protein